MTLRLLSSGRTADVFVIDAYRVLRRYRDGGDVAGEAAVMAYVGQLGFPVPQVYAAEQTDLVMQRLEGPTLLQALTAGEVDVASAGLILADLHTRLHALPPRLSDDPATRILHLDLHPGNVILTAGGPFVIDWRNATEGPPDLDIALTALIIAEVAIGLHPAYPVSPAQALLTASSPTPAANRSSCSTTPWRFGSLTRALPGRRPVASPSQRRGCGPGCSNSGSTLAEHGCIWHRSVDSVASRGSAPTDDRPSRCTINGSPAGR